MSKPDLNKNGTPRKHGNTICVPTRLDADFVSEQLDMLGSELGMARSTLIRHIVYSYFRDNLNDGSLNQQINQKRKSAERMSANQDVMSLADSLHDAKTALNRIGNLLNQDVKIRNTYIKYLDGDGKDEVRRAYEDERNKIQKRYYMLMAEQQKLMNASSDISEREKIQKIKNELKAKCDSEISLLDARYSGNKIENEKSLISANAEYDMTIKRNIDEAVQFITETMEKLRYGICTTVAE